MSRSVRYWCRVCGIVRDGDHIAPLCRHNVLDPPDPPERMVPIPGWHPCAPGRAAA